MVDAGPNFLGEVRQLRERRRPSAPDGWIYSRQDNEPVVPPPPVVRTESRSDTAPGLIESNPWYQSAPPPPSGPFAHGQVPQFVQPGVMLPPFTQSVILPPIFDDMMAMIRESRSMHLASLEQQRELMRYMDSLNDWLGHDVEDRQTEIRGVSDRIDQLRDDLNSLDLTRGTFLPPGPGVEPGGFIMPGSPEASDFPSPLGVFEIPVRPGSGTFVPPPPQATFPQPTQQYVGVVPPVVPHGYGSPTATWSPPFR